MPSRKQLLTRYCVGCHSDRLKTADLSLQAVDLDNIARDAAIWEKVRAQAARAARCRRSAGPVLTRPATRA